MDAFRSTCNKQIDRLFLFIPIVIMSSHLCSEIWEKSLLRCQRPEASGHGSNWGQTEGLCQWLCGKSSTIHTWEAFASMWWSSLWRPLTKSNAPWSPVLKNWVMYLGKQVLVWLVLTTEESVHTHTHMRFIQLSSIWSCWWGKAEKVAEWTVPDCQMKDFCLGKLNTV